MDVFFNEKKNDVCVFYSFLIFECNRKISYSINCRVNLVVFF